jgi:hypothetical protein
VQGEAPLREAAGCAEGLPFAEVVRAGTCASMWEWPALLRGGRGADLARTLRWAMEMALGGPLYEQWDALLSVVIMLLEHNEADMSCKRDALLALKHFLAQNNAPQRVQRWYSTPALLQTVWKHMVFEELCCFAVPLTVALTELLEPRGSDSFERHFALMEQLLNLARRPSAPVAYKDDCLGYARDLLRSSPNFMAILPSIVETVRDYVVPASGNAAILMDVVEECASLDQSTHFCSRSLARCMRKLLHSSALDSILRERCVDVTQRLLSHQRALIEQKEDEEESFPQQAVPLHVEEKDEDAPAAL